MTSKTTYRSCLATMYRRVLKRPNSLKPKQRYVVHYVNLKQAIAHGLQVDKVHRVLEFQQSAWLKPYIELNTEMRKKAANAFEIAFFKLMINAVFGKTMMNIRKRIRIELISSPERLSKLVNQSTFNDCIKYVGLAVLDINKSLIYKYFYDLLKSHFVDAISLVYMDTVECLPWNGLESFFIFSGMKGNNIIAKCVLCGLSGKEISTAKNTPSNLKHHISRVHPFKLAAFDNAMNEGKKKCFCSTEKNGIWIIRKCKKRISAIHT
ncbi:uncharacterized protein LOC126903125 isoform X1 [Daktulosphaira vitifoliae]|uniref:uncharacterized protein LOC126903125 isoform X1 n=1 Tax=Daktulosphaira vitifoliae TaxID=58002 RepID=UPI0021A9B317|nr:uncharacterized protein LOC126903125 isoform X1 [Daktulosphaira vitifoliae]XP_050537092.1 uncharacterized protein LOC126903125 isoform X1 [Daktulosphaira vitifoliae]